MLIAVYGLFAQSEPQKYPVKNGKVVFEANGTQYEIPIPPSKNTNEVYFYNNENGISISFGGFYDSKKAMDQYSQTVRKFYQGKKIFGLKVPKFENPIDPKNSFPPIYWEAKECKEPGKSVQIHIEENHQQTELSISVGNTCRSLSNP